MWHLFGVKILFFWLRIVGDYGDNIADINMDTWAFQVFLKWSGT
jgi:hypothetical protein